MAQYRFTNTWQIRFPQKKLWDIVMQQQTQQYWWKSFKNITVLSKSQTIQKGTKIRQTVQGLLPYSLTYDTTITAIKPPSSIEALASGDLEGKGKVLLTQQKDITTIHIVWHVTTTKRWMHMFSPILSPLFRWNHRIIMQQGAIGLAKFVKAELVHFS